MRDRASRVFLGGFDSACPVSSILLYHSLPFGLAPLAIDTDGRSVTARSIFSLYCRASSGKGRAPRLHMYTSYTSAGSCLGVNLLADQPQTRIEPAGGSSPALPGATFNPGTTLVSSPAQPRIRKQSKPSAPSTLVAHPCEMSKRASPRCAGTSQFPHGHQARPIASAARQMQQGVWGAPTASFSGASFDFPTFLWFIEGCAAKVDTPGVATLHATDHETGTHLHCRVVAG